MRILFLTSPAEDYLPDSLLHGFKSLFGAEVVDFPKCEILYRGCPGHTISQVRGKGFTLYGGLLDDEPVNRFNIIERVRHGQFDLIVFGSIWRQFGWFTQLYPWLDPRKTVILDGEDNESGYPADGFFWRRPYHWLLPRAHRRFLYFKREWTPNTYFTLGGRLAPGFVRKLLPAPGNLRRVAFSIPEEKLVAEPPPKTKDFPVNIVDQEVSSLVAGSREGYAFDSEAAYYADLQASRYGITTKRGGWDCLRHYEIAANGAVPCFRDLTRKPATCAPHGLQAGNAIAYRSALDLFRRIEGLKPDEYAALQAGSLEWARQNTTKKRAGEVLEAIRERGRR